MKFYLYVHSLVGKLNVNIKMHGEHTVKLLLIKINNNNTAKVGRDSSVGIETTLPVMVISLIATEILTSETSYGN